MSKAGVLFVALTFGAMLLRGKTGSGNGPRIYPIWDPVSEDRLRGLHPLTAAMVSRLIYEAQKEGIYLRLTDGYRSWIEQRNLYDQGRTAPGPIVTYANAGESAHNYGLAVDLVEISRDGSRVLGYASNYPQSRRDRIGQIGKRVGFSWGGDWRTFKDWGHFEHLQGRTITDWRADYGSGKLTYLLDAVA